MSTFVWQLYFISKRDGEFLDFLKKIESRGKASTNIFVVAKPEHDFSPVNDFLYCLTYDLPAVSLGSSSGEYEHIGSVCIALFANLFSVAAVKANEKGDYFPIWGTCLGHQLLTYLACGENLLTWTNTDNFALPLNFTKGKTLF